MGKIQNISKIKVLVCHDRKSSLKKKVFKNSCISK